MFPVNQAIQAQRAGPAAAEKNVSGATAETGGGAALEQVQLTLAEETPQLPDRAVIEPLLTETIRTSSKPNNRFKPTDFPPFGRRLRGLTYALGGSNRS